MVELLVQMDVPYIPQEWNKLRDDAYRKDPSKMGGPAVLGKYLSKMNTKLYKLLYPFFILAYLRVANRIPYIIFINNISIIPT